jgi:ferredoxin-NADP reductase
MDAMSNISAFVAGIIFVLLAAVNVVLMLEASHPARNGATRNRLITAHRVGGYLFVILLCIMAYGMSQRLAGTGITSHLPAHLVLHIVLVLALVPLLLLKILIARRYRHSHSSLKALGVAIFMVSFVLVTIPAFSEILRSVSPGSLGLRLTTGLLLAVCLARGALVFKRRKQARASMETSPTPKIPVRSSGLNNLENVKDPMTLLLAQIEQQTHDTKTLRFHIPKERRFSARPGQFLTFRWPVDGLRITRSYTISSSPTHENYVEITPKRMENGHVSVFLNDRAKPGLLVEASGPHGRFYFDETLHKNIVLLAAGSGITPMISMLRYLEDLHLATPVRLLYCVRTAADIIFQNDLERLGRSLANFKHEVCLSQPDPSWAGRSGYLTEEFVSQHVIDPHSQTFFLCGPQGFMDNARRILLALGVNPDQILQESFGESKGPMGFPLPEPRPVATVVFMRSEKVCEMSAGSTLLDLAEQNDVQIPYGCRQGLCGTCATRVLSGTVQMDVEAGLTSEQKKAGYVLPCVSRISGTVVLLA